MQTFSFSDKGSRSNNQDFYCLETISDALVAVVADGVGGNNGGEIASQTAVESIKNGVGNGDTLSDSLIRAHHELLERASVETELFGMATTLTATVYRDGLITGVHCGDSRAYILRGSGLKQLTNDHTEVARLLSEGKLTKEEAVTYPRKNILASAVGTHKELIHQPFTFEIFAKDRLLLLTDGVHGEITKKEICDLSVGEPDLTEFCKKVIARVTELGPSDNYTLLGIEFE